MGRKAATVTQAHIGRVLRAAKQAEAAGVEVRPDGTVMVIFDPELIGTERRPREPKRMIVL